MKIGATARGLFALYSTTVLLSVGQGMIAVTILVLDEEFGVSAGVAAQVVTGFAIGALVGQPLGGILVDRLGTRIAIVSGPIVIGCANLLAIASPWFGVLLVAMFIAGLGNSIWMLGREMAGVDLVGPHQRGRVMSGFMGMSTTGMALGPFIGGVVIETFGLNSVFFVYTGFAGMAFLVAVLGRAGTQKTRKVFVDGTSYQGERPGRRASEDPPGILRTSLALPKEVIHLVRQVNPELRATYLVLVFTTFSMMLYRMAFQSVFPLYGDELGFDPSTVGALMSISALLVFAMIIPAGFIVDKVGWKWAMVPSTAIPGIAFLIIPFADTFGELAILMGLIGIGNGLSLGSVATTTYDVSPDHLRGRLQALRRTVADTGAITGPLAGGAIANASGAGVAFWVYGPVILLAALLLLVAAKETLVKGDDQTQPRSS